MLPRVLFITMLSLLCGFMSMTLPVTTFAHTRFFMSEPAPDEELSDTPAAVRLWFSSPVETDFSRIEVKDSSNQRVDNKKPAHASDDPKILEVGLPVLQSGTYQVDWSVVSGDGHRVKGKFSFTIKLSH